LPNDLDEKICSRALRSVQYGELLRIARAQDLQWKDDHTNSSADPFFGSYRFLYDKLWDECYEGMEDFIIVNSPDFNFIDTMAKKFDAKNIKKISFTSLKQYVDKSNTLFAYDFTERFKSDEDQSLMTYPGKEWQVGVHTPNLASRFFKVVFQALSVLAKEKGSKFLFRIPIFYDSYILAFIRRLMFMNLCVFDFIIPKKAHDPFFYLVLSSPKNSNAKVIDSTSFLTSLINLISNFERGVIERHNAWEKILLINNERLKLIRVNDWTLNGFEMKYTAETKEFGVVYNMVKIKGKVKTNKVLKTKNMRSKMNTLMKQVRDLKIQTSSN